MKFHPKFKHLLFTKNVISKIYYVVLNSIQYSGSMNLISNYWSAPKVNLFLIRLLISNYMRCKNLVMWNAHFIFLMINIRTFENVRGYDAHSPVDGVL